MNSAPDTRCVVCLNPAHDHDGNGVCTQCRLIHRSTYEEVLALVTANDVTVETNAVLSTGEPHATWHQERRES